MKALPMFVALSCVLWCAATVFAEDADPNAALNDARSLASSGKYEEALQKHLWYHENAVRISPSQSGVRLSFALSAWRNLGEKYPQAREALVAVRDKDMQTFAEGGGSPELFQDIAAINGSLEEPSKTVALFKSLEEKRPQLAKRSYYFAEKTLADQQEYEICSRYTPDPLERLEQIKEMRAISAKMERPAELKRMGDAVYVQQICQLIKILHAANRKPEAVELRDKALAMFDDERFGRMINQAMQAPEAPAGK